MKLLGGTNSVEVARSGMGHIPHWNAPYPAVEYAISLTGIHNILQSLQCIKTLKDTGYSNDGYCVFHGGLRGMLVRDTKITTQAKNTKHIEQNINVEITKTSCKVRLINVFVLQQSVTKSENALNKFVRVLFYICRRRWWSGHMGMWSC